MNNPTKHYCKECGHEIESHEEEEDMELLNQMRKISKFDQYVSPIKFCDISAWMAQTQQEEPNNAKPRTKKKSSKPTASGATASQA